VGKLLVIPLSEDFFTALNSSKTLSVKIDEATGAADGFAIDFLRLLINRKRENSCKGNIHGRVLVKDSDEPVKGARVFTADNISVTTECKRRVE